MEAINMSSPNAPFFILILNKLTAIEGDIKELKDDVKVLKSDVAVLKNYNKIQSIIQEKQNAALLKKYLNRIDNYAKTKIIPFGQFYLPYNNNPLTDIDGCVIHKKVPIQVRSFVKNKDNNINNNINGNNSIKDNKSIKYNILDNSRVFFIESKHSMSKQLLDKKLGQFIQILKVINDVQMGTYLPKEKKYKFDDMIAIHNIKEFPSNISFLLSSDNMSPEAVQLAIAISRGTLNEDIYSDILFDYIITHPILKDIENDSNVDRTIVKLLINIKTLDEYNQFLRDSKPPKDETSKERSIYKKKETLQPYMDRLLSLVVPYSYYSDSIDLLKGKIGFIEHDIIHLPEVVLANGFNTRNTILNDIYNIR